jgi:hypothetical protein
MESLIGKSGRILQKMSLDGDFSNLDEINKLIESNPNEMPKVIGLLASKLVGSNQDDIEKALEVGYLIKSIHKKFV